MATPLHFVILAAGKGTRMKSELPKVLHAVGGEPMIVRILRTASHFSPVTSTRRGRPHGRQGPRRPRRVPGRRDRRPGAAARDRPRPAPGQAAAGRPDRDGRAALRRRADAVGRVDRGLLAHHQATGAAATVLTAHLPEPGRPGPHRAGERALRPDRRGARRVASREGAHRVQQRHLRVRAGRAVRRAGAGSARRTTRASTTSPTCSASSWPTAGASRPSPSPMPTSCAASTAAPSSRS